MQSNTDKNLNLTNWVNANKGKSKEKENVILDRAKDQELTKLESGEYEWITSVDKMGIKCRKLVKKQNHDTSKVRRRKTNT